MFHFGLGAKDRFAFSKGIGDSQWESCYSWQWQRLLSILRVSQMVHDEAPLNDKAAEVPLDDKEPKIPENLL